MVLLIFLTIFLLINVALLMYCNSIPKIPEWIKKFTWKGRKLISSNELENMRKCVNSKKSKF